MGEEKIALKMGRDEEESDSDRWLECWRVRRGLDGVGGKVG